MEETAAKARRTSGYNIIINTFEPILRKFVANDIFLVNYGNEWRKNVPQGVLNQLLEEKEIESIEEYSIDDLFDEFTFLNLKDILVQSSNFKLAKAFLGELSKDRFVELMDSLNTHRRKIAHAKSTLSELDLSTIIEQVRTLCQGERGKEIRQYLENEEYKAAAEIPSTFFEEYEIPSNLPFENYDLDGGFVGREKEVKAIRNFIKSDQDRVITITGAGGVGKTAIALKVAYSFLTDIQNPFSAVVWFSAKTSKLTDEGIRPLVPGITSHQQLIHDILDIVDPNTQKSFASADVPLESYVTYLNNFFSSQKCLLVIDNLETIIKDDALIRFIEEIPRPSQVLITSRKGLGEFERRYPITDMAEKDAVLLFRIVAKERGQLDLLHMKEQTILELVKRVRCYPLLIKWAIGQVCLGKEIDKAFSQIFAGDSEIAKFTFNDVFTLLSENSRNALYSMILYGDKPVSRYVLMNLANLDGDQFDDAIKELTMTSFVFPQNRDTETGTATEYAMLELTRGFIETKLDSDEIIRQMLSTRLYHLLEQIQEFEKSTSSYFQSLFSLGIKTPEEQVAFNYVKAAKNFYFNDNVESAEKNFELAIKAAPRLSYVLTEYSKFEYSRGHVHEALRLGERATLVNPESFHAWFNYGITLEKLRQYEKAIRCLQKAKELNPNHLPIFTELGRVYSFMGEHEKAEAEFKDALKEEKYPNYRHMAITLCSRSENYRRWSISFRRRRDLQGTISLLNKASETIMKAIEINPKDLISYHVYHKICIQLGIAYAQKDGFEAGATFLEKCIQTSQVDSQQILPRGDTICEAYFYLAALAVNEKKVDRAQVKAWINHGIASCKNARMSLKLNGLKRQVADRLEVEQSNRREWGFIKFFDPRRNYGIIVSSTKTYLFLHDGLRETLEREKLHELDGQTVSFKLSWEPEKQRHIAVDVAIEPDE